MTPQRRGEDLDRIAAQPRIIDSHAHVWDASTLPYSWLDAVPALPKTASSDQLIDETAAYGYMFIEAGVDAGSEAAEVAWVSRIEWPGLRGIVAAVDLRATELEQTLESLERTPLVVGVRHNLQTEPDGALADPRLRHGLEAVAGHGLTFDACVRNQQLGELATLIDSVPSLDVVIDHLGGPVVEDGVSSTNGRRWRDQIHRLAQSASTHVKISGLSAGATSAGLSADGLGFVRAAVDAFSAARCMIGSDWPVSTTLGAAASFTAWTTLVRSALSPDEWLAVAGETAERFYLGGRRGDQSGR